MGTYSYFRTVDVSTTSADYELLTDTGVQTALIERLPVADADELNALLAGDGIRDMNFQILGSGFEVSVNDDEYQPLFDNSIYSTGDYVRAGINSIRINLTGIDCQFRFNIL